MPVNLAISSQYRIEILVGVIVSMITILILAHFDKKGRIVYNPFTEWNPNKSYIYMERKIPIKKREKTDPAKSKTA